MRADAVSRTEAERRIAMQAGQNTTAQRLADELGPDRTGGAYIERGELVVTVLDDAAADAVRAAGARPRPVTHSTAELTAVMEEIAAGDDTDLESYFIDPESNAVVLRTSSVGGTRRATQQRHGTAVRFAEAVGLSQPIQDVNAGLSLTTSEFSAGLANCTAGFAVRDLFGVNQFMIQAAHCIGPGLQVAVDNVTFGAEVLVDLKRDVAAVANVFPTFWRQLPRIRANGQEFKTVVGQPLPAVVVGTVMCKAGRVTRYTCGTVQANFLTVPLKGWEGQTEINACALPGDSGGPVVSPAGPTTVFAAGSASASALYDKLGKPWISDAQGEPLCGASVGKPNTMYYAPLAPTLQQFGMVLATG